MLPIHQVPIITDYYFGFLAGGPKLSSGGAVISSISASSVSVGRHNPALTFCSSCCVDVTPAITLETVGRLTNHPIAISSNE
jgi:hypothetical protein